MVRADRCPLAAVNVLFFAGCPDGAVFIRAEIPCPLLPVRFGYRDDLGPEYSAVVRQPSGMQLAPRYVCLEISGHGREHSRRGRRGLKTLRCLKHFVAGLLREPHLHRLRRYVRPRAESQIDAKAKLAT